jgi:hypothetical protein
VNDQEPTTLADPPANQPAFQFSVGNLMALTVIVSMVAGYLRPHGTQGFAVVAITTPIAILLGVVAGKFLGLMPTRIYWSVILATVFQVITTDVYMLRQADYLAWPILAALVAAIVCVPEEFEAKYKSFTRYDSTTRMLTGGVIAAFFYCCYATLMLCTGQPWTMDKYDFLAFAVSGVFIGILVEACHWTAKRINISSLLIAFVLVILAIIFAFLAPKIIPGW